MKQSIDDLINKYIDTFDESFPMTILRSSTNQEIVDLVNKSLKENKPIEIEYEDDCLY